MTKKEKIQKVADLLAGKEDQPLKVYILIDGKCSDPDWPDKLKPHLKIFDIHVYTPAEIEAYQKKNGFLPQ